MRADRLMNTYLYSFRQILPVSILKSGTEMSYYYSLKSASRPTLSEKVLESDYWTDFDFSPASRPMAGPLRSELINEGRYKSWDSSSKHRILKGDLLEEAMRLAGIGADEASEGAEEDLEDLRLSGLSDLSLPDDMDGWDLDDVMRMPPPPFRPPPSPDQSEDEDEEVTDRSQGRDDRSKSQRDTDDNTSHSAEGSRKHRDSSLSSDSDRGSEDRDDSTDNKSDGADDRDDDKDKDQDDQDQDLQIVSNKHLYDPKHRPAYAPNRMDDENFCDLCDVPDRFKSWVIQGVPVYINKTFSRRKKGRMTSEEEIQAQAHIESLQKADLIELCGRSSYLSLPKVVPKGTSKSRLVIDYSHRTNFMDKTPFYLPSVYSVVFDKLPAITRDHYMIKIDLAAAFCHIKLRPEARHVTTFTWHNRHYRFKVLPIMCKILHANVAQPNR